MKRRKRSNKPQYQRIADLLRDGLVRYADQPPQSLPSEASLSKMHCAARGTIRSALGVLESEGLIRRSAGRVAVTVPEGIRAWQRMKHSRQIHVIVPHLRPQAGSWFDRICQGILTAAQQAGYTCSLEEMSRFPSISQGLRPQDPAQVTGVIVVGTLDERIIAMHAEAGYPVVCVDFVSSHPQVDAVITDCFAEGQQAVEFLLRHGHREFFYIGKNIRSTVPPRERPEPDAVLMEAGYRYALRLAGLPDSLDRVRYVMSYQVDYGELCRWIASMRPRPTAGVIFSNVTMDGLLKALPECQIRCPEDLSLISKSDMGSPQGPASVRTDGFRLGTIAVQTLLVRASGRQDAGLRIAVASTVQRGATLGFAPGSGPAR